MVAAESFSPDVPNAARMYDYYLGGKNNFPADREAAERVIALMPAGVVRLGALANRRFLGRAVRHLSRELGIRQFLDIGTGLPTMNNVHEVAQSIAPDSRVVYVDKDPVVIAHARALLHGVPNATIILGDLRDPVSILADPQLRSMLDFGQPLAVLLVAVLHFIGDDEDPGGIVATLMDAVPAGSPLVISHFTTDGYVQAEDIPSVYAGTTSTVHGRSRDEVAALFDRNELIDPGTVVWVSQWRPDDIGPVVDPGRSLTWCGVARKDRAGAQVLPPPAAAEPVPERLSGWDPARSIGPRRCALGARLHPDVPNVARMYDYYLGGKNNYPADRAAAEQVFAASSEAVVRGSAVQNRRFLGRAVRYLARDAGIRQFLDIGTGLPTMNSVHEVAQAVAPGACVVYVDNDPVVIAHARDMLNGVPDATIIEGDLRDPAGILADPALKTVLDFGQPVAVLLAAVLHFLSDEDDPRGVVATLMDAVPAGSHLVISHLSTGRCPQAVSTSQVYDDASSGLHFRTRAQVRAMLAGYTLTDPGELVWTPQWHPDERTPPIDSPGGVTILCGVARK